MKRITATTPFTPEFAFREVQDYLMKSTPDLRIGMFIRQQSIPEELSRQLLRQNGSKCRRNLATHQSLNHRSWNRANRVGNTMILSPGHLTHRNPLPCCQALKTSRAAFQRVSLSAHAQVWREGQDALRRQRGASVAGLFNSSPESEACRGVRGCGGGGFPRRRTFRVQSLSSHQARVFVLRPLTPPE